MKFPRSKDALKVRNILGLVSTPQHKNPFLTIRNDVKLTPNSIYRGYAVRQNQSEEWETRNHRGERRDLVLTRPKSAEIHTDGKIINKATLDAAIVVGSVEARKPHQDKAAILLLNEDYNEYCKNRKIPNLGAGTGETGFYEIDGKKIPLIKIFKAIPEYEPKEQYAPEQVLRHEYYHAKLIQKALDTNRMKEYEKKYVDHDLNEEHAANRYAQAVKAEDLRNIVREALNPDEKEMDEKEFQWSEENYAKGWKPGYYGSKEYFAKKRREKPIEG